MVLIIYLGFMFVLCCIFFIGLISCKEFIYSILFGAFSIFLFVLGIFATINYSTKTIPNFVYRTDSYKIYEYKCSDKIFVNTLKNDDDKFYLPESLLFVRCSGELDRK